jgi:hypothetical protein
MPNSNICVSTKPLGIQHPYSYCVKPSNQMVDSKFTQGGLTMKNTGMVLGGLLKYVDYLTINANSATATECNDDFSRGIIGNRYVLKTNIKCRRVDITGATISGEYYLHKYIDNAATIGGLITGGRPQPDVTGLIPSTFASAGKIGGNVMDIMTAFSGTTSPYCMEVNMRCHVIDSKNSKNNYKKFSPNVYLSLDDIKDIDHTLFASKPNVPIMPEEESGASGVAPPFSSNTGGTPAGGEGFTNLIDNIIHQNSDKIQSLTEFENAINKINFQDEFLIKTYYVGFSILLIILIFKLISKNKN